MTTRRSGGATAVAILGCALLLAGCSTGATVTQAPTTAPVATAASGPPATGAPTPIVSPSAAAGPEPIAEGTYRSSAIPITAIVARINADTKLSAAEKAADAQGFSGHTTQTITLDFHGGQFTESEAFDAGPAEVGARATYAFPDAHTLVIQEDCCGLSTFTITPAPGGFSLKYKDGAPNAGEDIIGQAAIYEIGPFLAQP